MRGLDNPSGKRCKDCAWWNKKYNYCNESGLGRKLANTLACSYGGYASKKNYFYKAGLRYKKTGMFINVV